MRKTFQDQLAAIRTSAGQRAAEESATPRTEEIKRKFGRIFQTDHTSLRLAQRDLDDIDREAARQRLPQIVEDRAVLFFRDSSVFVPIVRKKRSNRADDWFATTAFKVRDVQEARRKAREHDSQLIVIDGSASGTKQA